MDLFAQDALVPSPSVIEGCQGRYCLWFLKIINFPQFKFHCQISSNYKNQNINRATVAYFGNMKY